MTDYYLELIQAIPAEAMSAMKDDGLTVQSLAVADLDDLTIYDKIGSVTAGRIIQEARNMLAEEEATASEEVWPIRSQSTTVLVVPQQVEIDGVVYSLAQSYRFPRGGVLPVPRDDALILLEIKTKAGVGGCCNSDGKSMNLFVRAG